MAYAILSLFYIFAMVAMFSLYSASESHWFKHNWGG